MVKFIDHLDLVAEMNKLGWLRVELTSSVGWDGFPDYANKIIGFLSGVSVVKLMPLISGFGRSACPGKI